MTVLRLAYGAAASILLVAHGSPAPAPNTQPWTQHVIDSSSRGADGVRAADANGDGLPDLVTGWEQGGLTRVYVASRGGWHAVTVGKSPDVEDAVLFDDDGDGAVDIVTATEGDSRKLLIHWAPPRIWTATARPRSSFHTTWPTTIV